MSPWVDIEVASAEVGKDYVYTHKPNPTIISMEDWDPEPRIKEWAAERGQGKEMAYAEGFRVVTLVTDEDWEKTNGRVLPDES